MSVVINGSAGVTTNTGAVYDSIQSGTAVASTSGTSIDFTSIPSWVKRITVMFNGVSTNGSSPYQIQLGTSGGVETTGYNGMAAYFATGIGTSNPTTGLQIVQGIVSASYAHSGTAVISLLGSNTWCGQSMMSANNGGLGFVTAVSKTLSGTLDRVRITTVNGTDTFDAGSINILYE